MQTSDLRQVTGRRPALKPATTFSRRESYYVIVTLKNGKRIGGKYGLNSYSSTYPNPEGIYLEEVWKLNDEYGFDEIVDQTEGILITENEISTIEFYI
jgi:hypothetical protein